MKSKRNFILIVLVLLIPAVVYPQKDSSAVRTTDSTTTIKKGPSVSQIVSVALPVSMIAYGAASFVIPGIRQIDFSTQHELKEDKQVFHRTVDDFIWITPAAMAFALKAGGLESEHSYKDMFILYALSNTLNMAVVYTTKNLTTRLRPDHSDYESFPSGHTSTAFVAAEFLHQEYKDKSAWISVGGYAVASLVGVFRIYNNKHWVSDVIAGAGIGILSTRVVYWTYPYLQKTFGKKKEKKQAFLFPSYNEGLSLNFSCVF